MENPAQPPLTLINQLPFNQHFYIMNLKHQIFMALLGCVFILCSAFAIAQHSPATAKLAEGFLKEILEKYAAFHTANREDKVYIHCDKPQYEPGETVWFAVYLRNGDNLKASETSGIVHVEIMNPRGAVERTYQIVVKEGVAQGDFLIDENAVGGLYKLRAFSNWMMNDKEPAVFEKEITVQEVVLPRLKMKLDFPRDGYGAGANVSADLSLQSNENQALANFHFTYTVSLKGEQILQQKGNTDKEGNAAIAFTLPKNLTSADGLLNVMIDYQGQTEAISRAVPILLNNVKLSFYPEGGDLVTGLPARVGFKAMNEFNKPTDIEGYITDNAGNTVANFSTYHKGMGAFSFTPKLGQVYMAHITEPRGVTENYPLPTALDKGYVLKSEKAEDNKLTFKIYSSENEKMGLVLNVRGKNYASAEINAQKGENTYSFPTNDIPAGVAQVTLFDAKGIERCERLVFVNPNKQLSIDIKTDKEKYLPREKVNMTINVKDERGMPMPAQLSLSVVNDQLLSFADDKSSNILSWLLVESDLKGKVEEPNFYFDKKEEKAPLALDYLLMTTGWRRFTWKEVQSTSPRAIAHLAEDCTIAGTIYDYQNYDAAANKYKPAEGATLTIMGTNITTKTDKDGKYSFKGHEFTQPFNLSVMHRGVISQYIYVNKYGNNYDGHSYLPTPTMAAASMDEME
ncbi:MAG: MG2 domain-containing protein, partial [Bacteroidia bacterium]